MRIRNCCSCHQTYILWFRILWMVVRLERYRQSSSDWWTDFTHHYHRMLLLRLLQVQASQSRHCCHCTWCPNCCQGNQYKNHRPDAPAGRGGLSRWLHSVLSSSCFVFMYFSFLGALIDVLYA